MYSYKQLSSWVYDAWHLHAKGQYFDEVTEAFCKNGHHKLSVSQQHSAHSVTMAEEIQNKLMFMVPRQFSMVIFTDDIASIFFAINHVSAPKLPSLISVTCQMDTRKAHTVPYNELCHFWHPVCTHFSVIQLVMDNSVHYPSFCALH